MHRRDILKLAGSFIAAPMLGQTVMVAPGFAQNSSRPLRFGSNETLEHLDPYYNSARLGALLAKQVWDTLIYRDPQTNEYHGLLATSWEWAQDTVLEMKLRQGVKFHNGDDFSADDVVYTLNYIAAADSKIMNRQLVDWIDHVDKVDDFTVRIHTKGVFPPAIEYLVNTGVIYPHKYYAEVGPEGMNEKPVGTGPYRIVGHERGRLIQLESFDGYFDGGPKRVPDIARVDIRLIPDLQTQIAEIMAGGLDLIVMPMPPDQAEQIAGVPNVQVKAAPTMRVLFLTFDSRAEAKAPALRDERVRRAILHAIDRKTMVKAVLGEGAEVLDGLCLPSQFGCPAEGVPTYEYDPVKAKALLAEAGYADGFEVDFYAYRERTLTEAMIVYLQAVGIRANLVYLQYAAFRDQVRAGNAPITFQTWASYMINDVSALTPIFFKFTPDDIARDPEVRDLLETGDTSGDPAARQEAYGKAIALIQERAYALPISTMPTYFIGSAELDFVPHPDETPRFWEIAWK